MAANLPTDSKKAKYILKSTIIHPEATSLPPTEIAKRQKNNKKITRFFTKKRTQTLTFTYNFKLDKEKLNSVSNLGELLSAATEGSEYLFDYGSYIAFFLGIDQSGTLLKFSQIIKLLSRLRLIDIDFGVYLSGFMDFSAQNFDKKSELSDSQFSEFSDGFQGKLTRKKVALSLGERRFWVPITIYLVLTGFGYLSWFGLTLMGELGKVNGALLWWIGRLRRLGFVSFNMVVLDVMFYGARTVLHVRGRSDEGGYRLAVVCLFLNILDILCVADTYLRCTGAVDGVETDSKGQKTGKHGKKGRSGEEQDMSSSSFARLFGKDHNDSGSTMNNSNRQKRILFNF